VPALLQMLPKPLGFGKVTKMQPLTALQRKKLIATICELQICAGVAEGCKDDTHDSLLGKMAWIIVSVVNFIKAANARAKKILIRTSKKKKRQQVGLGK
jgi:hypothetical protein